MRNWVLAILTGILILIPLQYSNAANPKAGDVCSKLNKKQTYNGKIYTCIKSGKKLVWDKGGIVVKPNPNASISPHPSASPSPKSSASTNSNSLPNPTKNSPKATPSSGSWPKNLDSCQTNDPWVIGEDSDGTLVYLSCGPDFHLHPENTAPAIDQSTGLPKTNIITKVPPLGSLQLSVQYVNPPVVNSRPNTQITNSTLLAPVSLCKIPDAGKMNKILNNPQQHFVSGFSPYPDRANLRKNPIIQFIPVDFPDLQGQRSPILDYSKTINFLKSYWETMSTDMITLNIRIPEHFFRLPKKVLDYNLQEDFFQTGKPPTGTWDYVQAALNAADSSINFSDVDIIAIVPPAETTRLQIAGFTAEASEPGGGFITNEKKIMNTLVAAGPIGSEASELLNWAHESGHMMGLTDLRNIASASSQDISPLGVFDLMNSEIVPELLAWNRFILGILNDNQVRCVVDSAPTTHWLSPVELSTTNPKLLIIPTGEYTALAVESRRPYGFDSNLGSKNSGAIIYTIDTRIPYRLSPLKIIDGPSASFFENHRDAALMVGDSIVIQNWKITCIETGEFGDVIKVEKI